MSLQQLARETCCRHRGPQPCTWTLASSCLGKELVPGQSTVELPLRGSYRHSESPVVPRGSWHGAGGSCSQGRLGEQVKLSQRSCPAGWQKGLARPGLRRSSRGSNHLAQASPLGQVLLLGQHSFPCATEPTFPFPSPRHPAPPAGFSSPSTRLFTRTEGSRRAGALGSLALPLRTVAAAFRGRALRG